MKIVVFDFDKTLTYCDTINQLFLWRINNKHPYYLPLYILLLIATKLNIISVKQLKELCIKILFPSDVDKFNSICRNFAPLIKLNEISKILLSEYENGSKVVVLSASPINYLQYLFKNIDIIATTLKVDINNKIVGIKQHPYGHEKLNILNYYGIEYINEMYYDSVSDEVLLPISEKAYKIKNGFVIKEYINEYSNI